MVASKIRKTFWNPKPDLGQLGKAEGRPTKTYRTLRKTLEGQQKALENLRTTKERKRSKHNWGKIGQTNRTEKKGSDKCLAAPVLAKRSKKVHHININR